jgi:phosphate acetyltransferase
VLVQQYSDMVVVKYPQNSRSFQASLVHNIVEPFATRAAARNGRIVFPEGDDPRIMEAAVRLAAAGLARPLLLGEPESIRRAAEVHGSAIDGIAILDPYQPDVTRRVRNFLEARKPGLTSDALDEMAGDPLYLAGVMVEAGEADGLIAGAVCETAKVISAALRTVGRAEGVKRLSSYFLMSVPNHRGQGRKDFIFSDCAVNIDPSAEDLAEIAIASMATATKLLDEPARGALLSFSTKGSAAHAAVSKVTEALAIVHAQAPDLAIEGELLVDAALVPSVAARKVKGGKGVAGDANVLIFPDLNSGNIGYKLVQYMANADAIGPFFQGFSRPVCDLSRGCSVEDVVSAAVILMATAD